MMKRTLFVFAIRQVQPFECKHSSAAPPASNPTGLHPKANISKIHRLTRVLLSLFIINIDSETMYYLYQKRVLRLRIFFI